MRGVTRNRAGDSDTLDAPTPRKSSVFLNKVWHTAESKPGTAEPQLGSVYEKFVRRQTVATLAPMEVGRIILNAPSAITIAI